MSRQSTFADCLKAHKDGLMKPRPVVKPKPLNLPTDPDERSRVIIEAARHVIERHRDELERLAHK